MDDHFLIDSLKIFFETEISNHFEVKNDVILVKLLDGTIAKIEIKKVA